MAELSISLAKLNHNIAYLHQYCLSKKLEIVGVIKASYALPFLFESFQAGGVTSLGLSKARHIHRWRNRLSEPPLLISIPSLGDIEIVVEHFKSSMNSEVRVIRALAEAAEKMGKTHEILLMVDNGDLREGVMPDDVLNTVEEILSVRSSGIKLAGLGANLGCASGTLPDEYNIAILQELADDVERKLGYHMETISIGGSVMLDWMEDHVLPVRVNQIRIGEAILLGNIPCVNRRVSQLYDDVFIFKSDILEIKEKPSISPGRQGTDALGHRPKRRKHGVSRRAILNFGISDTDPTGLIPCIENFNIVTYNTDYALFDITDCAENLNVGDPVTFKMSYRSLTQALISPFNSVVFSNNGVENEKCMIH